MTTNPHVPYHKLCIIYLLSHRHAEVVDMKTDGLFWGIVEIPEAMIY